jgi:hypothetical protein
MTEPLFVKALTILNMGNTYAMNQTPAFTAFFAEIHISPDEKCAKFHSRMRKITQVKFFKERIYSNLKLPPV